jgi:hypothetical protein
VIRSLGSEFCKISSKHISDEELNKKKAGKKGAGAVKAGRVNKKKVSQMKTRKPRRLGRTRRVSLRQIFTFCASSFHSRWMAMPGNSCDISFVWWYFVNFTVNIWAATLR